jgi:hypothetical protein
VTPLTLSDPRARPLSPTLPNSRGNGMWFGPSLCNDRPMTDVDDYWRTRCVGEAIDQGYAFLRLTCACGRITDYPFPLLLQRRGVSRDSFIGNIGFRCQKCGNSEPSIGVHSKIATTGASMKYWRTWTMAEHRSRATRTSE